MAVPVEFKKQWAEQALRAIQDGSPISPPDGRWNRYALMAIAGVCQFAAISHGPVPLTGEDYKSLPAEYKEAYGENFETDTVKAIGFYCHLARMVKDDGYDSEFENLVRTIIYQDGEQKCLRPLSGFKKIPTTHRP